MTIHTSSCHTRPVIGCYCYSQTTPSAPRRASLISFLRTREEYSKSYISKLTKGLGCHLAARTDLLTASRLSHESQFFYYINIKADDYLYLRRWLTFLSGILLCSFTADLGTVLARCRSASVGGTRRSILATGQCFTHPLLWYARATKRLTEKSFRVCLFGFATGRVHLNCGPVPSGRLRITTAGVKI